MDRWIALDPLYRLSITSFFAIYNENCQTQQHLVVKDSEHTTEIDENSLNITMSVKFLISVSIFAYIVRSSQQC